MILNCLLVFKAIFNFQVLKFKSKSGLKIMKITALYCGIAKLMYVQGWSGYLDSL